MHFAHVCCHASDYLIYLYSTVVVVGHLKGHVYVCLDMWRDMKKIHSNISKDIWNTTGILMKTWIQITFCSPYVIANIRTLYWLYYSSAGIHTFVLQMPPEKWSMDYNSSTCILCVTCILAYACGIQQSVWEVNATYHNKGFNQHPLKT